MSWLTNSFNSFKTSLYKNYGENPGKMLVHTGVLGWILSSLAQISAVAFNDKISPEQKSFLIPQEAADAAINILSFYVITSSFKNLASKLVSTGKLTTRAIKNGLLNAGIREADIGSFNFNIDNLITNQNLTQLKKDYKPFKNGVDVVASTIGSIISCNIVTPILRNQYAAKKQKKAIATMNEHRTSNLAYPKGISINDYQKMASMKYSSNLKI